MSVAIATSRRLSKKEVADLLGVSPDVVAKWVTTRVIPPEWVTSGDGREHMLAPVTVALGLLIADLCEKLKSPKSPVPFLVAKQVAPRLAQAWPEPLPIRLTVQFADDAELRFQKLDVIRRAQERISAMAEA